MCGIFGHSLKKNGLREGNRALLAGKLGDLNDERGGHSWGMLGVEGKEVYISRGMGMLGDNAHQLINHEILLAHTRFATTGAKNVQNAHPFEIGDIIGAHNGIIHNHDALCTKYERKFEVDSMHLFAHLNSGLDFDDIQGYGAIEWVNKKELSKVYLCKLDGGSLSVYGIGKVEDKEVKGIVWTSDDDHMIEAMEIAGIKEYFEYKIDNNTVYYVENGELYFTDNKLNFGKYEGYKSRWEDFYDMKDDRYKHEKYGEYTAFRPDGKGGYDEVEFDEEFDEDEAEMEIAQLLQEDDKDVPVMRKKSLHDMTDADFLEHGKEWETFCKEYYGNKIENDDFDEGYGG